MEIFAVCLIISVGIIDRRKNFLLVIYCRDKSSATVHTILFSLHNSFHTLQIYQTGYFPLIPYIKCIHDWHLLIALTTQEYSKQIKPHFVVTKQQITHGCGQ
jgi:hypothetical protein